MHMYIRHTPACTMLLPQTPMKKEDNLLLYVACKGFMNNPRGNTHCATLWRSKLSLEASCQHRVAMEAQQKAISWPPETNQKERSCSALPQHIHSTPNMSRNISEQHHICHEPQQMVSTGSNQCMPATQLSAKCSSKTHQI